MKVAALFDIHANLPALEAVLDEIGSEGVDHIVIGGDVVPGPMMRQTLARVMDLGLPTGFIHGNGELAMLAQFVASDPSEVAYWGTTSGAVLPEPLRELVRWSARQVPDYQRAFESWPRTLSMDISALGEVLFCHATPLSETDGFTRLTPEECLLPVFSGLNVVVCGHTHMQFDRMIGTTRVVNAGSVGMPFGHTGADWLLLGPQVELRHTDYDLAKAAERFRSLPDAQAREFATSILQPPSESAMLDAFTRVSF